MKIPPTLKKLYHHLVSTDLDTSHFKDNPRFQRLGEMDRGNFEDFLRKNNQDLFEFLNVPAQKAQLLKDAQLWGFDKTTLKDMAPHQKSTSLQNSRLMLCEQTGVIKNAVKKMVAYKNKKNPTHPFLNYEASDLYAKVKKGWAETKKFLLISLCTSTVIFLPVLCMFYFVFNSVHYVEIKSSDLPDLNQFFKNAAAILEYMVQITSSLVISSLAVFFLHLKNEAHAKNSASFFEAYKKQYYEKNGDAILKEFYAKYHTNLEVYRFDEFKAHMTRFEVLEGVDYDPLTQHNYLVSPHELGAQDSTDHVERQESEKKYQIAQQDFEEELLASLAQSALVPRNAVIKKNSTQARPDESAPKYMYHK